MNNTVLLAESLLQCYHLGLNFVHVSTKLGVGTGEHGDLILADFDGVVADVHEHFFVEGAGGE